MLKLLKPILKNLRWILLPVTIIVTLLFVESATDSEGICSDEEGIMYAFWLLLIANVLLFIFNKKWQDFLDQLQ
ncbi:MAG: hypothetical protein ACI30S_00530 [Muribaculaceae bacterium]